MLPLVWNPFSISYLVELILVSTIAGYFLSYIWADIRAGKNRYATSSLFVTFAALSVSILLQFFKTSLHTDYATFMLAWISPAGIVSLCGFIHFAYRFPAKLKVKSFESYIMTAVYIGFIGFELFVALQRHILLLQGYVEYRPAWMDLLYLIGFGWVLVTFFRQMVQAIITEEHSNWFSSTLKASIALLWIWKPLSPRAVAARAFLFVSILPLLLVFILYLRSYGIVSGVMGELVSCGIFLFLIFGFAIVFLNYAPERSSFRIKLIGITLTTTLTIMSGVSWLIGPIYVDAYEYENPIEKHSTIRFEPSANGYTAAYVDYNFEPELGELVDLDLGVIDLPFEFEFFGKKHQQLFIQKDGFVAFEEWPAHKHISQRFGPQPALYPLFIGFQPLNIDGIVPDKNRGLFFKTEKDRMIITWNHVIGYNQPHHEYSFQLVLHSQGAIEFNYADMPENVKTNLFLGFYSKRMIGITPGSQNGGIQRYEFTHDLPIQGIQNVGLMEDYRLDFILYLDRIYAPIAYFIMVASLFILVAFPIFFRISLDQPLAKLLNGVEEFRSGKLSTIVAVSYRDEIGFLTQSFNEMAKNQNELVHSLEDKVKLRTAEAMGLATQNVRLEERNYLSRELHDTVNQTLFSASLIADTLPELWQRGPTHAERALNEVRQLNRNALSEMRQLLFELRPAELSEHPLGSLLQKIVQNFEQQNDMKVNVQIERDLTLPENVQITFYRIAQECLNNISKHANASEVNLTFDAVPTQAMLTISDTGQGFNLKDVPVGHMGLKIMKERVELIGGTLEIETAPNKGTSLTIIWFENDTD